MFATLHHQRHNQDTSDRIRRSFRNRFQNGSILVVLPYGDLRPEGAKTDDRLAKDADVEPVYQRWFELLDDVASYSEVADWLNDAGVPVGDPSPISWPGRRTPRRRMPLTPILYQPPCEDVASSRAREEVKPRIL